MRTPGITGLYQKTYLDNDMYRFDYSHYITGYLDSDDGNFYDEYDHMIPFIRDLDFLDSKENYYVIKGNLLFILRKIEVLFLEMIIHELLNSL